MKRRNEWVGGLIVGAGGSTFEPSPTHDPVDHPSHYVSGPKCPGCDRTIECIDITRWLPFNPGNVVKYLWRRYFGGKVGEDPIEPVRKARWYLDDEVRRLEGVKAVPSTPPEMGPQPELFDICGLCAEPIPEGKAQTSFFGVRYHVECFQQGKS